MRQRKSRLNRTEQTEVENRAETIEALGNSIGELLQTFFETEENRHEYEQWHLKTFGQPYSFPTKTV